MDSDGRRIYHFHVRKTAGSSLNASFWRLGGPEVEATMTQGDTSAEGNGLRFTDELEPMAAGNFFFASSHRPYGEVRLPPGTFKLTILRDPIARVKSYYRYVQWVCTDPDSHIYEPFADRVKRESWFLDGGVHYLRTQLSPRRLRTEGEIRNLGPGQLARRLTRLRHRGAFSDLVQRLPPRRLSAQLYMFSESLDPVEASNRILDCDAVLFTETFPADLAKVADRLDLKLDERHERRFGDPVEPTERDLMTLRKRLSREYEMIERVRDRLA